MKMPFKLLLTSLFCGSLICGTLSLSLAQSSNKSSLAKLSRLTLESGIQSLSFCPKGAEAKLSPMARVNYTFSIPLKSKHALDVSLAYAYSRLAFSDNVGIVEGVDVLGDEVLSFYKVNSNNFGYSRLNSQLVELAAFYSFQPHEYLRLSAGLRLQHVLSTRSDLRYTDLNNNKVRIRNKDDFYMPTQRIGLELRAAYKRVEVFGNVGLTSIFEESKLECNAPVYPFTAGVAFEIF